MIVNITQAKWFRRARRVNVGAVDRFKKFYQEVFGSQVMDESQAQGRRVGREGKEVIFSASFSVEPSSNYLNGT